MGQSLRIVVADDERDMRDYFCKMLPRLGHQVVAVAGNGLELLSSCRQLNPDLVMTDVKMPELDGIEALQRVFQYQPLAVILVSGQDNFANEPRVASHPSSVQLTKPFKQAELKPAIELAQLRFTQFQVVLVQASELAGALADFAIVDRAKRLVIRHGSADEQEAFEQICTAARESACRIVEKAQEIVDRHSR